MRNYPEIESNNTFSFFYLGTLIDSIIDEFLQHLHQHARVSADILNTNPKYEIGENVDLIFENGEIQEELTHNLYLIQAYSDVLQPDHYVKMIPREDRYKYL